MLFNSLQFAIFFPVFCILYFAAPARVRTSLLLVASCIFYMAFIPVYILILFVTILIDYIAGIYIERSEGRRKHALLWLSIVATCCVLFVFKYFHFFTSNFIGLAGLIGWNLPMPMLKIILPIGLSFHTFQSLSYVVEVYRGHQKAEPNFITYATYVMFFPQLVAGPIERPQNLLHQFYDAHPFDYDRITSGLKRMAWGFFKKLVVADRLALYVNDVYAAPQNFNGLQLTIATIFFAYQIYCDFSGYSDIAIGSARILGFKLMENFNTPYYALSVSEFWQRWHISLSTWFRDYVYVPLGGSRRGPSRWLIAVMITFAVSGLWHGANWTYVVWGVLNGLYLVAGKHTKGFRDRVFGLVGLTESTLPRRVIMLASTFALTCLAWIIFRAKNLPDSWYVMTHLTSNWNFHQIGTEQFLLRQMPVAAAGILILEIGQFWQSKDAVPGFLGKLPMIPRWALYAGFTLAVLMFGIYRNAQFIYFQF
jgi:D-alanyl-lipoteichoic acid acyltransferase DltB (MBOAT superfamily)